MNVKKIALAVLFATPLAALAHHAPASWDLTQRVSVTGEIKEVQFRNPHGHMVLAVKGADGKVSDWEIETSAANLLLRRGWKFKEVHVGDTITATGHPNKERGQYLYIREIKLKDGRVFGDPTGNDKALD